MRLFAKLFLYATLVISIALLISGYLLITISHESAVSRESDRALNQFQYDRFIVQANMIANAETLAEGINLSMFNRLSSELSGMTAFFNEDRQLIYTALPPQANYAFLSNITGSTHVKQIQTIAGETYLIVGGRITQSNITIYLLIANDISTVIAQREQMTQSFVQIYFLTLIICMIMILILSTFLTRPLNKMNIAAAQIAKGRYYQRLHTARNDEIGELSDSFNLMAEAIEEKIHELQENARQKEEFVANVAHELKTPLTSVIGYADMIYQKSLPPQQTKDAAWYILNEGLRLESLSLKLMDLIVLGKQDFILEEMSAKALMLDISGTLMPMLTDKAVNLKQNIQPAYIKVEYDLFKTLMFNLIDNAVKAGCTIIEITGKQVKGKYCISVIDNGRGIPEQDLARITEAFYTVDKSRSRRQHGAGIGLALVAKIAKVHGGGLVFNSAENVGTAVRFDLICERGSADA